MSEFLDEFKRRIKKIKNLGSRPIIATPDIALYSIIRHTTKTEPAVVMWNLPLKEAEGMLEWKFKTHLKHEDDEEIIIWYTLKKQENF